MANWHWLIITKKLYLVKKWETIIQYKFNLITYVFGDEIIVVKELLMGTSWSASLNLNFKFKNSLFEEERKLIDWKNPTLMKKEERLDDYKF